MSMPFKIKDIPTEPGIYKFSIPLTTVVLASVYKEYWNLYGKRKLLKALDGTPYTIGCFYPTNTYDEDGSPLSPGNLDLQTPINSKDNPGFDDTFFSEESTERAWFQPGNIIMWTSAKKDAKGTPGVEFLKQIDFYLIVAEKVDVEITQAEIDIEEYLKEVAESNPEELSGMGFYPNLGFLGLGWKTWVGVILGGIAIIGWMVGTDTGRMVGIKLCKLVLKGGNWFIEKFGPKMKDLGAAAGKAALDAAKKGVDKGKEVLAKKAEELKIIFGELWGGIKKGFNEFVGDMAKKAKRPAEIALWVAGGLIIGFGVVKILEWLGESERTPKFPERKRPTRYLPRASKVI